MAPDEKGAGGGQPPRGRSPEERQAPPAPQQVLPQRKRGREPHHHPPPKQPYNAKVLSQSGPKPDKGLSKAILGGKRVSSSPPAQRTGKRARGASPLSSSPSPPGSPTASLESNRIVVTRDGDKEESGFAEFQREFEEQWAQAKLRIQEDRTKDRKTISSSQSSPLISREKGELGEAERQETEFATRLLASINEEENGGSDEAGDAGDAGGGAAELDVRGESRDGVGTAVGEDLAGVEPAAALLPHPAPPRPPLRTPLLQPLPPGPNPRQGRRPKARNNTTPSSSHASMAAWDCLPAQIRSTIHCLSSFISFPVFHARDDCTDISSFVKAKGICLCGCLGRKFDDGTPFPFLCPYQKSLHPGSQNSLCDAFQCLAKLQKDFATTAEMYGRMQAGPSPPSLSPQGQAL